MGFQWFPIAGGRKAEAIQFDFLLAGQWYDRQKEILVDVH